ncbi:polysaccharide pyruvyl transferase family protein [Sulfurospirillum barnesii]|uniref:Polysaccharide pyruvyl transferase domain-containing protein n=1 Tax=Sulfurospirillum barnesii (strain ATCC 700032 / DSM 10660 / SES-3) TaxID=760154 RepID=I3XYZ9_SULBS|nr:polysaccharide pyruvyl transferase family protein [Sulfurospirillum barnesii]AFL69173.1 hypothetical protein Sulba_1893 [Sulfurospirillum barnesii SES-3]
MKILHIASFKGNIGDNASHIGFYSILEKILKNYEIEQVEIRKFYKNYYEKDRQCFDSKFIDYLNTFDMCFIGGGGFLDYWVPDSQTGTTIDIELNLLGKVMKPTYFTRIGSNPHKKIPKGNIEKFRNFLNEVNKNKNLKIALRNDGSIESIKRDIGEKYLENICEILDHGFFYTDEKKYSKIIDAKYVAINITSDQMSMCSEFKEIVDKAFYLEELKKVIDYCINYLKCDIVFVPHIYSDLKAISELLEIINDSIIRKHITIAPCIQGDNGTKRLFSIYKQSEFVIGTRFHANVCSLAMGKYTIGLVVLDRVKYLYDYFGISERAIVLKGTFSNKIIELLKDKNKKDENTLEMFNQDHTIKFYKKILSDYNKTS